MRIRIAGSPVFPLVFLAGLIGVSCAAVEQLSNLLDTEEGEPVHFDSPDSTAMVIVECQVYLDPGDTIDLANPAESIFGAILGGLGEKLSGKDERSYLTGGVLAGDEKRLIEGRCFAKTGVLFHNLRPGMYRLSRLMASQTLDSDQRKEYYDCKSPDKTAFPECPDFLMMTYQFPDTATVDFTFQLEAGDCVYLGKLLLSEEHSLPFGHVEKIDSRFEGGAWIPIEADKHKHNIAVDYELNSDPENELLAIGKLDGKYGQTPWSERWAERIDELEKGK